MSTDVFNSFWNDPKQQYVYTNLTCSNLSSGDEITFNIGKGVGEISDNNEVLSSIDLSKISSGLSTYSNSTKIIPANSIIYIGADKSGKSFKRIVFGKFFKELILDEEWQSYTKIVFNISWIRDDNTPTKMIVEAQGTNKKDVIDVINDMFNDYKIKVEASLMEQQEGVYNLLAFTSLKEGYDFYIDDISYYLYSDFVDDDYKGSFINDEEVIKEYPMEEYEYFYIPSYKYFNGAYKGIIIKPTYPKFNNDINEEEKSLKLCHIKDRIKVFVKNKSGDYSKKILDVYGNHFDREEFDNCIIINDNLKKHYDMDLDDSWLNDENKEWVSIENGNKVIRNTYCGLYGYANYASATNMWTTFGDVYMVIANDDYPTNSDRNLITPVILYNPNNFEVKVDILTFEK